MESMADAFLRCVSHGCLAGCDPDIDRRPYHKNCTCALHDRNNNNNNNNKRCSAHARSVVSYPIRRAWSEGSLASVAASGSGISSPSSEIESLGSNRR